MGCSQCFLLAPLAPLLIQVLAKPPTPPRRPDLPKHKYWLKANLMTNLTTQIPHTSARTPHPYISKSTLLPHRTPQIPLPSSLMILQSGRLRQPSPAQPQATLFSSHSDPRPVDYKRKVYTGDSTSAEYTLRRSLHCSPPVSKANHPL